MHPLIKSKYERKKIQIYDNNSHGIKKWSILYQIYVAGSLATPQEVHRGRDPKYLIYIVSVHMFNVPLWLVGAIYKSWKCAQCSW